MGSHIEPALYPSEFSTWCRDPARRGHGFAFSTSLSPQGLRQLQRHDEEAFRRPGESASPRREAAPCHRHSLGLPTNSSDVHHAAADCYGPLANAHPESAAVLACRFGSAKATALPSRCRRLEVPGPSGTPPFRFPLRFIRFLIPPVSLIVTAPSLTVARVPLSRASAWLFPADCELRRATGLLALPLSGLSFPAGPVRSPTALTPRKAGSPFSAGSSSPRGRGPTSSHPAQPSRHEATE